MLKFYIVAIISIISYSLFSQTTIISLQDFDETNPQWSLTSDIPFFDNNFVQLKNHKRHNNQVRIELKSYCINK